MSKILINLLFLQQTVEFGHGLGLDGIYDVNVGFHGLVVGVTGPFHDDVGGDAHGQGLDDEGAAAGMGANEFPLGMDGIGSNVSLISGDADGLVDLGQLAEVLQAPVHGLVGEGGDVFVFFQDGLGDIVQLDGDAVACFDGGHVHVVTLDVAAAQVVGIGMPEAGKAAEKEDVPDGLQLGIGEVQVSDPLQLFFRKVYNGLLCLLEGRLEGFESRIHGIPHITGPQAHRFAQKCPRGAAVG